MTTLTLIIIICTLAVAAAAVTAFFMANADKSRYLEKICYLEGLIRSGHPTRDKFIAILDGFDEIISYNMDLKRTRHLFKRFCKDYINEWIDLNFKQKNTREHDRFMSIHNHFMSA